MRLGIISDAHHYLDDERRLCTLTPVARQFEQWAGLFDEVVICAPLLAGRLPASHSRYLANNISLLPIANAGGNTITAKLNLLAQTRDWWNALRRLLTTVDAVHIRCPNNISILGLVALRGTRCLRQAVYTGTWIGYPSEPLTYRWQRWFLRRHFNGPVAVYGEWPNQPPNIVTSFSPSYSKSDWEAESAAVAGKIERLKDTTSLPQPIKLLTVGALSRNKNQQLIIRAVEKLRGANWHAELHILGEGEERGDLTRLAGELGVAGQVHFHGSTPHHAVRQFYREADFVVQAPFSEGYGKVPVEAFFHGAIPVLSDVNLSSQLVGGSARGRTFPQGDAAALALGVTELAQNPSEMIRLISNGRAHALSLTLEAWQQHLREMLERSWKTEVKVRKQEAVNAER